MKTLILTEKPSVGRDFAKALNVSPKGQGFFENNEYIITWAIGHLLELKAPDDYDTIWKSWSLHNLPILPARLGYKSQSKTKKQLAIVKKQLKRKDLNKVVVATDAGREGELIARTLIDHAKTKTDCYRFWTSQALSPAVIQSEMQKLKPLEEFERLYYAGRARQSADWLVGMNLSRLATIRMGELFSVGRVQTAVLSLLVERRRTIDNFKPEPYFTVQAEMQFSQGKLSAQWFDPKAKQNIHHIIKKADTEKIVANCQNQPAKIVEIEKLEKSQKSPQLFSLTELQKVANRLYGFSAKKTLSLAQGLYEKEKCLSYPRTDARVLGQKSLKQVQSLLQKLRPQYEEYYRFYQADRVSLQNRYVFNDAKLTDHHALIPLKAFTGNPKSDEGKIYTLVLKRFLSVFSSDYRYEENKIVTEIAQEHFLSKGQRTLSLGWKYLSGESKDKLLIEVEKNEIGQTKKVEWEEKATKPPAEYTEASLLQDMIHPARLVEEQRLKKIFLGEVGLGTQATRAQIIETLLDRSYIIREKRNLIAQAKGMALIDTMKNLSISKVLTSPEETAKWEIQLSEIAQAESHPREFMLAIRDFVKSCTEEWKKAPAESMVTDFPKTAKTKKFRNKTKSPTNRTKRKTGTREISDTTNSANTSNNKSTNKSGPNQNIKKQSKTKNTNEKNNKIGDCPNCNKAILDFPKAYSCEGWKDGCKFVIWKTIAGKKISAKQAKLLLKKGKSDEIKGFLSKKGSKFSAILKLEANQVKFDF